MRAHPQLADARTALVNRQCQQRGPVGGKDHPMGREPGVLDSHPGTGQRACQQKEPLRGACADHDRLGVCHHPAHAPQMSGQRTTQL
jgi:hypothetical protein